MFFQEVVYKVTELKRKYVFINNKILDGLSVRVKFIFMSLHFKLYPEIRMTSYRCGEQ